jgi:GT2 family glycosyltransferase
MAESSCPVTVVVVTYRSKTTIDSMLQSVARAYEAGLVECVVVDNASGDGTVEHVRREYGWATVVDARGNRGFGSGCNLGIQHAATPYVLLLNPDARMEPESIEQLARFMNAHDDAGI